jgi:demethylmenaquinone methyltransferase/2-methoxy-6-polyprenyl-1,4-benzoquinol methylase
MKITRDSSDKPRDENFPKKIYNSVLPSPNTKRKFVKQMFDDTADKYDRTNAVITLGLDTSWRKRSIKLLECQKDDLILDVASGTGDLCNILLKKGMNPISMDFSEGMLMKSITTAPRVQGDALQMPFFDNTFNGVTCGFSLRNFTDIETYFKSCARVLKPKGRLMAVDATTPSNPIVKFFHAIWFRGVIPILGKLSGSSKEAYRYLPLSTAYLPDDQTIIGMLEKSEFEDIEIKKFMLGSVICITATRKG